MWMKTALIMLVQYQFSWELSVHLFVGFIELHPEYHIQVWLLFLCCYLRPVFYFVGWGESSLLLGTWNLRLQQWYVLLEYQYIVKKKSCVWIVICIICTVFVNFLETVQLLMPKLCRSWQGMLLYPPPNFTKKLCSGCIPPAPDMKRT